MAPNQKSVPAPLELTTGPAPVLPLQRHNPFDDLPDNLVATPVPSSFWNVEDDHLFFHAPPVVLGVPSTENATERRDDHTPVILVPPPQGEETTFHLLVCVPKKPTILSAVVVGMSYWKVML
jgi:hypothetical protein